MCRGAGQKRPEHPPLPGVNYRFVRDRSAAGAARPKTAGPGGPTPAMRSQTDGWGTLPTRSGLSIHDPRLHRCCIGPDDSPVIRATRPGRQGKPSRSRVKHVATRFSGGGSRNPAGPTRQCQQRCSDGVRKIKAKQPRHRWYKPGRQGSQVKLSFSAPTALAQHHG
jgi:hypothetical protein